MSEIKYIRFLRRLSHAVIWSWAELQIFYDSHKEFLERGVDANHITLENSSSTGKKDFYFLSKNGQALLRQLDGDFQPEETTTDWDNYTIGASYNKSSDTFTVNTKS